LRARVVFISTKEKMGGKILPMDYSFLYTTPTRK